jgi:uncharacterized cupin superfamily protein
MATITLNNIKFTISDCEDGEYFFQADTKLHPQTLAKAVRKSSFEQEDIAWFSPKHGNFSVKVANAEFCTKMYLAKDVKEKLDL